MFFEKRSVPIRGSGSGLSVVDGGFAYFGDYVNAEQAIRNSDVWTAVNILASDIARVKFKAKDEKVNNLLANPSRLTNRFNFWQSMVASMLLSGNAYALRRVKQGQEFLEFVQPDHVTVWLSDDGQTLTYDFRFDAVDEPDEKDVQSSDVVHLRMLTLNGGMVGRSPLVALNNELTLQDTARKLTLTSLRKAIMPSAVLKAKKPLMPEARENARAEFEKANSGDNAGRVIVMDTLFDFTQSQVSADVAKLLNSTDWTRNQIAKAFMMPTDMLGGESEHSNAEQITATYNTTLGRYLQPIVDELQMTFGVEIDADVRTAIDLDGSQVEARTKELFTAGILSQQQAVKVLSDSTSDIVTDDIAKMSTAQELEDETNGKE